MLQLTSLNMHKMAAEPSDSSWMKACGTNNSIRFSTRKQDTIEPVHISNPSSQDQGQHKLWWKSAQTHTHTQTFFHLKSNRSPHHSASLQHRWKLLVQCSSAVSETATYMLTFQVSVPGEYTPHNKANHWNLKQFIKYCYLIPVLYNLHILSKMCKNKEMRRWDFWKVHNGQFWKQTSPGICKAVQMPAQLLDLKPVFH